MGGLCSFLVTLMIHFPFLKYISIKDAFMVSTKYKLIRAADKNDLRVNVLQYLLAPPTGG